MLNKINYIPNETRITAQNLNEIQDEIINLSSQFLDKTYPIGTIYLSVSKISPAALFGGTWEQIKDRFLLCSGDIYNNKSIGGNAFIDLAHNHTLSGDKSYATIGNYSERIAFQSSTHKWVDNIAESIYTWTHTADTALNSSHSHYSQGCFVNVLGETNSSQSSVSNLPPYIAVTVWKRIA